MELRVALERGGVGKRLVGDVRGLTWRRGRSWTEVNFHVIGVVAWKLTLEDGMVVGGKSGEKRRGRVTGGTGGTPPGRKYTSMR